MGHSKLLIQISAPFPFEELTAEIEHDCGKIAVPLVGGRFDGTVPGRPLRIKLLEDARPASLPTNLPTVAAIRESEGTPVAVEELFETGVEIPEGGRLAIQLVWGTPCHQAVDLSEGRRFGSYEHQLCAVRVGKDRDGERLRIGGRDMPIAAEDELPVGGHRLRFGDIIALAGDFYAHLDDRASEMFAWAWPELGGFTGWLAADYRLPPLATAAPGEPKQILDIVDRDKDAKHGTAGELCYLVSDSLNGSYPARRYLALASQNCCHFGSQPPDGRIDDGRNTAFQLYRAYHQRALAEARAADDDQAALLRAFACDAFGCHFLTDLFASGHMRVPRRELGDQHGIVVGALWKAHQMHAEDNRLGLWCAARGTVGTPKRLVWRAYGDGMLRTDEAQAHLGQVREAVRRSAAEVFAASRGEATAPEETAEWLLPVPLAAGQGPRARDQVLGDIDTRTVNHYPRSWLLANGRIASRIGGPADRTYRFRASIAEVRELQFGDLL